MRNKLYKLSGEDVQSENTVSATLAALNRHRPISVFSGPLLAQVLPFKEREECLAGHAVVLDNMQAWSPDRPRSKRRPSTLHEHTHSGSTEHAVQARGLENYGKTHETRWQG